jgi:ribonuclease Z
MSAFRRSGVRENPRAIVYASATPRALMLVVLALLSTVVACRAVPSGPPPDPDAACPEDPDFISSRMEARARAGLQEDLRTEAELLNPDDVTVVTCGTGSPVPSDRVQACTAVFVGGQFLLFDAGDGAQRSMETLNFPSAKLGAVFVTHFHSDHIADLGEVMSRTWMIGRATPLPVFGPAGIERIVEGFNTIYASDERYRHAHHGDKLMPLGIVAGIPKPFDDVGVDGKVVYDEGGVVVRAFNVNHAPVTPAVGYRIEYRGRVVAISGDSDDAAGLRALATDADILVVEAMEKRLVLNAACGLERAENARPATIFRDIMDYHIDVLKVAELANAVRVKRLVMTHLVPALEPDQADRAFGEPVRRIFAGEVVVAQDGTRVVVDLTP